MYRTALAAPHGPLERTHVAESFFGTLRAELVDHGQYRTHEAAKRSIADYIDSFYNIERRHSFLDYVNPIEFDLGSAATRVAA